MDIFCRKVLWVWDYRCNSLHPPSRSSTQGPFERMSGRSNHDISMGRGYSDDDNFRSLLRGADGDAVCAI